MIAIFEIPDVVSKVEQLATDQEGWMAVEDMEDSDDYPAESVPVSIQLSDSSILKGASYSPSQKAWLWRGRASEKKCPRGREKPITRIEKVSRRDEGSRAIKAAD